MLASCSDDSSGELECPVDCIVDQSRYLIFYSVKLSTKDKDAREHARVQYMPMPPLSPTFCSLENKYGSRAVCYHVNEKKK